MEPVKREGRDEIMLRLVFVVVFVWWNTPIRSGIYLESLTGFAIRAEAQLKPVIRYLKIADKELVVRIHVVELRGGS